MMRSSSLIRSLRAAARRATALSAALVAVLILGAIAAPAAQAAQFPTGPFSIAITKLEQPEVLGQPGSGLPIADPTAISPPVAGATFAAWRVPGIDVTTNSGQQQAGALTPAAAAALVDTSTAPAASDVTDLHGDALLGGLAAGLYYVVETVVPAGFAGSTPFLVMLPLTHPVERDSWLSTVHVYPKNSRAGISLEVRDQNAYVLGDIVGWRSVSSIPNQASFTGYQLRQLIDPRLELRGGAAGVALHLGAQALVAGVDYAILFDPASNALTVDFLPAGLAKLAAAVALDPAATVTLDYETAVLAEGQLRNTAELRVDGAEAVVDRAETCWGPIEILVHLHGDPSVLIPGATFQLFRSAADAAAGANPLAVGGRSEWITDANGVILIEGLRFSNFANGADVARGDPLFREYFVIMTRIPDGYEGVKAPIGVTVVSSTQAQIAVVELTRSGGGDLPITGGQIAGAGLLAALLLGGGLLLLLARRREVSGADAGAGAGAV